jgi:low temperature requirement protein LtrA
MLLGALWWAWAAYAWLTNTLNPEEDAVRLAVFGSLGAMLIVSLAVPHAFGADGVAFGVAYFIVRALHLVLYAIAGRGSRVAGRGSRVAGIPSCVARCSGSSRPPPWVRGS